ncbi:MAG: J domain-containing protein [Sphingomonadales bacterium]|nr:J domain-containing protein [Sphingomonadales bacterium]
MSRSRRSNDWGFPRWRSYGGNRDATELRLCDRYGCEEPGDRPAPKSPNSSERWFFCERHAGEYNRNWNYFEGLTKEQREEREKDEQRETAGFTQSAHHGWAGPGDGSRSSDEMRALEFFDLEPDIEFVEVKAAWRRIAKENHPDVKPGDAEAAQRFAAGQAAWEILRAAEERREWKGG